jgi:hypothetical protein
MGRGMRTPPSVIAQQYSSATFVSLRLTSVRKNETRVLKMLLYLFSFLIAWERLTVLCKGPPTCSDDEQCGNVLVAVQNMCNCHEEANWRCTLRPACSDSLNVVLMNFHKMRLTNTKSAYRWTEQRFFELCDRLLWNIWRLLLNSCGHPKPSSREQRQEMLTYFWTVLNTATCTHYWRIFERFWT